MFKKLITACAAGSLLIATPAIAHDRDHRRDGVSVGAVVGAVLITAIVLSSDDRDDRYRDRDDRYYYRGSYYDYDGQRDGRGWYHRSHRPRAERYSRCHDVNIRNRYGTYETIRVCD